MILRIISVFVSSALGAVGIGSLIDVDSVKAMVLSGATAVVLVVKTLLGYYARDGKITEDDIDSAFGVAEEEEK